MKSVGILGSGFGLYGYMPAFANLGFKKFIIEQKNRKIILKRNDLKKFLKKIVFVKDKKTLLNLCNILVIAKRPKDQRNTINYLKKKNNILKLHLEKPLDTNPNNSKKLLKLLNKLNKKFTIGYLFHFTKWGKNLINLKKKRDVEIIWKIKSFNLSKKIYNWKTKKNMGGGVIRFYGIHFLALLSKFNGLRFIKSFTKLKYNKYEFYWYFECICNNKIKFKLLLNSDSATNKFLIKIDNKTEYSYTSPFDEIKRKSDKRIKFVEKVIKSNISKKNYVLWNKKVINNWKNLENLNQVVK